MAQFDTPQIGYFIFTLVVCRQMDLSEMVGHWRGFSQKVLRKYHGEVFAENQYGMYNLIHERAGLHKLFEACYRDNLHSIWAGQELYKPGNSKEEFYHILQKNMQPVYDSARRQGYEIWNY